MTMLGLFIVLLIVAVKLKSVFQTLKITPILMGVVFYSAVFAQTNPSKTEASASSAVYAEKFKNVCAACHGLNGANDNQDVPRLAGQHSFYAITQLFLFREGRRNNPAMVALAKQMSDDDMRGFSDYIGTLVHVPVNSAATPINAEKMLAGQKLANEHRCSFCHGNDMAGGKQVPRIGGQKEDYLLRSLRDLKSGVRPPYTRAMTETLSQVPEDDYETLAYYISRIDSK